MFVKVPVYFDVQGSIPDASVVTEWLQILLENMLLEKRKSLQMTFSKKDRVNLGLTDEQEVFLIRKKQVLDGVR